MHLRHGKWQQVMQHPPIQKAGEIRHSSEQLQQDGFSPRHLAVFDQKLSLGPCNVLSTGSWWSLMRLARSWIGSDQGTAFTRASVQVQEAPTSQEICSLNGLEYFKRCKSAILALQPLKCQRSAFLRTAKRLVGVLWFMRKVRSYSYRKTTHLKSKASQDLEREFWTQRHYPARNSSRNPDHFPSPVPRQDYTTTTHLTFPAFDPARIIEHLD